MKGACGITGCVNPAQSKGLCSKHYQRLWVHGDPLIETRKTRGEGHQRKDGYVSIRVQKISKLKHHIIAETALGKPLPPHAIVHHVDLNPSNNVPNNLVICPNSAYHNLLHQRMRALDACGNANWNKCWFCQKYDDKINLRKQQTNYHHLACRAKYYRDARQELAKVRP